MNCHFLESSVQWLRTTASKSEAAGQWAAVVTRYPLFHVPDHVEAEELIQRVNSRCNQIPPPYSHLFPLYITNFQ